MSQNDLDNVYFKVLMYDPKKPDRFKAYWSKDRKWQPGVTRRVEGPLEICVNGLHLTQEPGHWLECRPGWEIAVFVVEKHSRVYWQDWSNNSGLTKKKPSWAKLKCLVRSAKLAAVPLIAGPAWEVREFINRHELRIPV
jgi:hypothetical protein